MDAGAATRAVERLRRYNFEREEVEAVAAPADNLELMPSDTPLGTAIMLWEDVEIVYAFNDRALLVTDGADEYAL